MTELYKKRLELLGEIGEIKVSKNKNHYVILSSREDNVQTIFNSHNLTKNTLHKVGQFTGYKVKYDELVMLTSDNRLLYKAAMNKAAFVTLSKNIVREEFNQLKDLYFYNKKCEYLKNYESGYLAYYSYLKGFNSLKSAFSFLGCYDKNFYTPYNLGKLLTGNKFKNKLSLLKVEEMFIQDCITMINQTQEFEYYQSFKTIENIHDELSYKVSKKKIQDASNEEIVPSWFEKFDEKFRDCVTGLKYYKSERQLLCAGIEFKNCIASRFYNLDNHVFFSFNFNGDTPIICEIEKNITGYYVYEAKQKCNVSNLEAQSQLYKLLNLK
jgi:hypothetical protein